MRSDMPQVLIERPRRGSRMRGYRRQRTINKRARLEDEPRFESIRRRKAGTEKWFRDLFGPVRRFLRRNVGRPWDLVFSEICEHARLDNVAQQHLRRHVRDFVVTNVQKIDGRLYGNPGWGGLWPLRPGWFGQYYVCPDTGLLKMVEKKPRPKGPGDRIMIDKTRQYHRINGEWYAVALRPVPEETAGLYDALIERPVAGIPRSERISRYGFDAYALSLSRLDRSASRDMLRSTGNLPRKKRRRRKRRKSGSRA